MKLAKFWSPKRKAKWMDKQGKDLWGLDVHLSSKVAIKGC